MNTRLDALRSFYTGKIYPVAVALLIFLGHCTGREVIFGSVLMLTLIPALLICHDFRFAVLPFLCSIFIVSVQDYTPSNPGYAERYLKPGVLIPLATVLTLLLAALVCFIVRNRKISNPLSKQSILWSMVIFCAALLCNGIFSSHYTVKNLFFVFFMIFSLLVVYILFALFLRFDKTSFDYFLYCLVIAGLLILAELVFAYGTTVQFENGEIVKGSVVLGWGVWTNIGGMLAFLMPACFYFAASHKHGWIGFLLGLFEYFGIVLSQSRGALLVGSLVLVCCLTFLCFCGNNKKINRIFTLGIFSFAVLVFGVFSQKFIGLVQNFLNMGFADNGRFEMWSIGLHNFLKNPIFGSGFYDSYSTLDWDMGIYPYLYHCTVVQLLGSTGLVGTLAYAYHRFCTVRLVVKHPSAKKTFLGFCILSLLLFSLTDVLFFKTYPTIYYSLMLLFIERADWGGREE